MNDTISPCSLSDLWLLKPLDRHLLLTSFHICSCWHFGNWSIAQAAMAVFTVTSSCLSLVCSTAGWGVCMWTDCPPCPSPLPVPEIAQPLTYHQLTLFAPLKPFPAPSFSAQRCLCSCCWYVSRWGGWELWSQDWRQLCDVVTDTWALGGVAGRSNAYRPSWRSSEQRRLSWQWVAVIAVSRVTAAHECATVVSSAPHIWVCVHLDVLFLLSLLDGEEFNEGIPIVVCSQGVGMCGML